MQLHIIIIIIISSNVDLANDSELAAVGAKHVGLPSIIKTGRPTKFLFRLFQTTTTTMTPAVTDGSMRHYG